MTDHSDASPPHVESLVANQDFLFFIVSRVGTVGGSYALSVTVGWELYVRTGSPFLLGLVGLAKFLPFLFLFLAAGLVADRCDRRRIMTLSNAAQALAALSIGISMIASTNVVWPVFFFLFLHGAAQAFLTPAIQSTLPNIVSRAQFPRAVAVSSSATRLGQLFAPGLAGVLLATVGPWAIFSGFFFGIVAAISAAMIRARLVIETPELAEPGMLLGGLRHILHSSVVLGAISLDLISVLFGSVLALLPIFASDILQVGPAGLGALRAAPAVGGLAMGLLLVRVYEPRRVGPWFFAASLGFGLSIVLFSLSNTLWLSLVALCAYGATDMYSVYVRQSLVQLHTPDRLRGRVNAANGVVLNASNELGDFRAGAMAAAVGTVPAIVFGAGVTLVAVALWIRLFPALRRIDRL